MGYAWGAINEGDHTPSWNLSGCAQHTGCPLPTTVAGGKGGWDAQHHRNEGKDAAQRDWSGGEQSSTSGDTWDQPSQSSRDTWTQPPQQRREEWVQPSKGKGKSKGGGPRPVAQRRARSPTPEPDRTSQKLRRGNDEDERLCHSCGGRGHIRRDCPNHQVTRVESTRQQWQAKPHEPQTLRSPERQHQRPPPVMPHNPAPHHRSRTHGRRRSSPQCDGIQLGGLAGASSCPITRHTQSSRRGIHSSSCRSGSSNTRGTHSPPDPRSPTTTLRGHLPSGHVPC